MEIRSLKPYFVTVGLMALTSLALGVTVDTRFIDEAGIRIFLPDQVGAWKGEELRFCNEPGKEQTYKLSQLEDRESCTNCPAKLDSMSLIERQLLPPDTEILKKVYDGGASRTLFASIVMSGRERASIHRPENCNVGAGSRITRTRVIEVPLAGRKPVHVKVLDIERTRMAANGRTVTTPEYFAYWFVGKDRETPSNWARMFWMAADRIMFSRSHRWSYIALSGLRTPDGEGYVKEVQSFVAEAYPQMLLSGTATEPTG